MTDVISMEAKLTQHWQDSLEEGQRMTELAKYNLGRIATAYSDQLHFDLEYDDEKTTTDSRQ